MAWSLATAVAIAKGSDLNPRVGQGSISEFPLVVKYVCNRKEKIKKNVVTCFCFCVIMIIRGDVVAVGPKAIAD